MIKEITRNIKHHPKSSSKQLETKTPISLYTMPTMYSPHHTSRNTKPSSTSRRNSQLSTPPFPKPSNDLTFQTKHPFFLPRTPFLINANTILLKQQSIPNQPKHLRSKQLSLQILKAKTKATYCYLILLINMITCYY